MKGPLTALILLLALAAYAQQTNAPAPAPDKTFQAQAAELSAQASARLREPKPNEIFSGQLTYSGIGVQAAKPGNPLQLVNPFAPAQYGSPEDNLIRDPISGKISGLKIFAVRF